MNSTLKWLLKKKKQTYNCAKNYQCKEGWNKYRSLKQQSKGLIYQQHKQYLSNLIDSQDNSNNLKGFWHYIKGKCQDNVGIGALNNQANDTVTDSTEKAEILNKQFK